MTRPEERTFDELCAEADTNPPTALELEAAKIAAGLILSRAAQQSVILGHEAALERIVENHRD